MPVLRVVDFFPLHQRFLQGQTVLAPLLQRDWSSYVLDLRRCRISPYAFVTLAEKIVSGSVPCPMIILADHNRLDVLLTLDQAALKALLSHPTLQFVSITNNYILSGSRLAIARLTELYQKAPASFGKLVLAEPPLKELEILAALDPGQMIRWRNSHEAFYRDVLPTLDVQPRL